MGKASPVLALFAAACLASAAARGDTEFRGLGGLPGAQNASFISSATAVNADGSVVVGIGAATGGFEAFRWTLGGGIVAIGDLPGGLVSSRANAVSAEGDVVVGAGSGAAGPEAFRWTPGEGLTGLGYLPGGATGSAAHGVSANGNVVVGWSASARGTEAFRWTGSGGMAGLGDLPGGDVYSVAQDASADGEVVVGFGTDGDVERVFPGGYVTRGYRAFRWTAAGGMVSLVGDRSENSEASAVSADGQVIVGSLGSGAARSAFRWTAAGGPESLGALPDAPSGSIANDVSADGKVVVGLAGLRVFSPGSMCCSGTAFRWTAESGMQSVPDWLGESGLSVEGWRLGSATGVNADGSVVVGDGYNPGGRIEAWLARADSGLIGLDSFADSLGATGTTLQTGASAVGLVLHGAHHRPLMTYDLAGDRHCAWATGDAADLGHDRDATLGLAEIGGCTELLSGRLRAGLGVGRVYSDQDLPYGGSSRQDGNYLMAEIGYRFAPGILGSVSLLHDWSDATVKRGYWNGGSLDRSTGETDVKATAVRIRGDWLDAARLGPVGLSMRVAYTYVDTRVDGYTESGGGFPATFAGQAQGTHEVRAGLDAQYAAGPATRIRGMLEGAHRFDGRGAGVSGTVIGLFDFDLQGQEVTQSWLRIGAEVEHRLHRHASAHLGLNASTDGADPVLSGGGGLRVSFR